MRARHRHFNPAHAGANVALDSRYGFAQSDNTDISTWDDRSPNNADATQSNTDYKPKYRTNIIGGSPAIQFTAASNSKDRLDGSITITNNGITTICCWRMGLGSGVPNYARIVALSKNNANDYDNAARGIPCGKDGSLSVIGSTLRSTTASVSFSTETWYHWASTYDGTTNSGRLNETTEKSLSASGNLDVNQYRLGMAFDSTAPESNTTGALNGYIASISIFNFGMSAPLRKKLQFANAFSFKLACN